MAVRKLKLRSRDGACDPKDVFVWGGISGGRKLMRLRNDLTGDVLEIPPPDMHGNAALLLNGEELFKLTYSDNPSTVTVHGVKMFATSGEFAEWVTELIAAARGGEKADGR